MNSLYYFAHGKFIDLPIESNPYYDRLYKKYACREYIEHICLIQKFRPYYIEAAKSYLKILEDNSYFLINRYCRKTYTDAEMKELLLDFFNDEGVDKYNIVKSLFDEERVSISSLEDQDFSGFCTIPTSDIKPYVIADGLQDRVTLKQIADFAHEFGHAIEGYSILNRYNKYNENKNRVLSEVSSLFYELEFLRYLQRNKINPKETADLINKYQEFGKIFLAALLDTDSKEIEFGSEKFISNDEDFYIDDSEIVRPFKRVDDEEGPDFWLSFELEKPLKYGFGLYMALHLSELRKQDHKEFDKMWNYYLSTRTLMKYSDIFNLFGFDLDRLVSGKMIEPTIKRDIQDYKKQLKRQL